MAGNVLSRRPVLRLQGYLSMEKPLQIRVAVVTLAALTLIAVILAALNLSKEGSYQIPTDSVSWVEAPGGLIAQRVLKNGPGERAGIKAGDLLVSANGAPVPRVASLIRQLFSVGIYRRMTYNLVRSGVPIDATVILEPTDRSVNQGMRLIGLIYLAIGLYILFRRWTAWHSMHFYVFCLTSFVLYSFNYTGQLNTLDWIIYWGKITAEALQPALFLHLALAFTDESPRRRKWTYSPIYLPAVVVVVLQVVAQSHWSATELLETSLNRIAMGYLGAYYLLAAALFFLCYRRQENPLRRQQLKWLTRGTLLTVIPLTALNIIPYLAGIPVPGILLKIIGVFLIFLPLTFSWAIIRYRLMDVDLIFKRGVKIGRAHV